MWRTTHITLVWEVLSEEAMVKLNLTIGLRDLLEKYPRQSKKIRVKVERQEALCSQNRAEVLKLENKKKNGAGCSQRSQEGQGHAGREGMVRSLACLH